MQPSDDKFNVELERDRIYEIRVVPNKHAVFV